MRPIALLILALALTSCQGCPTTTPDAGTDESFGTLRARATDGGFEIELVGLSRPIKAIQIPVVLEGASATEVRASGTLLHDLVEAGLTEPKTSFVLVVGDTRGILIDEGVIAFVSTTGAGSVTFGEALAVDETGATQTLAAAGAP